MGEEKLVISPPPHITSEEDIPTIMYAVIYSLIPASLASIYFFGWRALILILLCVVTAISTEALFQNLRKKEITAFDGSAIITGLLFALTLPPSLPFYLAILGSIVAIVLGKQIFGGLGHNIFNPALVGRAFLQAAFPVAMTTWTAPFAWLSPKVDAKVSATPLALMKFEAKATSYLKLFWGNVSGSLGETSAFALLLGAIYLFYRGYIDWRIPGSYLGTVFLFSGFFWFIDPRRYPDPLFQILAGGLLLGAFFMATDYVTTPITPNGQLVFGFGAGLTLVIIRLWGGLQEGVMYSILLMNAVTPLINRFTQPRIFGK